MAKIYKGVKLTHGIVGPVPVILAEDETKVKGRVAWEQKFDTLTGFCGIEKNHICVVILKPIVGSGNDGYNNVFDSYTNNRVGRFAKVVMVNHCIKICRGLFWLSVVLVIVLMLLGFVDSGK